jgi:hypothetical protein
MPPKKGKKAKGETEEEKEARLIEEARLAELERKRLAEEAEKKRLEEERIAAENKANRVAEMEWLTAELTRWTGVVDKRSAKKVEVYADLSAKAEWAKYKDPSDQYDVTSERDINTFLRQVADSKDSMSITALMTLGDQMCGLVATLDDIWAASVASDDSTQKETCMKFKQGFYDVLRVKIDQVTSALLNTADQELNDRGEYQIERSSAGGSRYGRGMGYFMWTSLSEIRPIRKSIIFEKAGVQIDVPKQILVQESKFAHRLLKMPIDIFGSKAYDDLLGGDSEDGKVVVGDLYIFDILFSPPTPFDLSAKKWILKDRTAAANELRLSPYPSTVPCKLYVTVPAITVMSDDIVFAYFDPDHNKWSTDALTEYSYDAATRQVVFLTAKIGVFAFIKRRTTDFPYKSWSLAPRRDSSLGLSGYEKHAELSVVVGSVKVVIAVIGTECELVAPPVSALKDLIGKRMAPGALMLSLQKRGINMVPCKKDPLQVPAITQPIKDSDLELAVMKEMALCSSTMEFSSTAWNGLEQMGPSRIGLLVREAGAYAGGDDTFDYECVLVEKDLVSDSHVKSPEDPVLPGAGARYTLVMGNEYGNVEGFSHKPRPNEKVRVDLLDAMDARLTDEAKERVIRTNGGFEDTVLTLLRLVRPLVLG